MSEGFVRSLVALIAVSSVLPILPVIQTYTSELTPTAARRYSLWALAGGNLVGVAFVFVAPPLFDALSLSVNDLRVAGGIILLVYATHDILFSRLRSSRRQFDAEDELGSPIAPLGVPILMGPATLSTLVVLSEVHGAAPVIAGLLVAAGLNALSLVAVAPLLRLIGEGTSRAIGKVMSLVLATLGAGMLRAGLLVTTA
ncbi:MAG: multiple antibiotic resistance protein [Myxococcota bacterium]|jgi:multiple antibiotic resistance protein